MIRRCAAGDFEDILAVINEAAEAYRGVIPADRWREPYMPPEALRSEMERGVNFWGCESDGALVAVMGMEDLSDVTLIRHAYTRPAHQRRGIGSGLLALLAKQTDQPILIGTWKDAVWAIAFYEKHGFRRVGEREKDLLLRRYWRIPERQIETSVVLSDRHVASFVC